MKTSFAKNLVTGFVYDITKMQKKHLLNDKPMLMVACRLITS